MFSLNQTDLPTFVEGPGDKPVSEEVAAMRSLLREASKKAEGTIDRYQQRLIGVENRKKSILWTLIIQYVFGLLLFLGAVFVVVVTDAMIAHTTLAFFLITSIVVLVSATRVLIGFLAHMRSLSRKTGMIAVTNKEKQKMGIEGFYPLKQEKQDCELHIRQLRDFRAKVEEFMANPEMDTKRAQRCLEDAESFLDEDERRATRIYGEL